MLYCSGGTFVRGLLQYCLVAVLVLLEGLPMKLILILTLSLLLSGCCDWCQYITDPCSKIPVTTPECNRQGGAR